MSTEYYIVLEGPFDDSEAHGPFDSIKAAEDFIQEEKFNVDDLANTAVLTAVVPGKFKFAKITFVPEKE